MHKAQDKQIALHRRLTELEEAETDLCRRPSLLDLPAVSRRKHVQSSRPSSRASSDINGFNVSVLHWDATDIDSWLDEVGMKEHDWLFKKHSITTGRRLLSLTEAHLKEMGIVNIGQRVELLFHIDELRKMAGLVSRAAYIDIPTLFDQSVFVMICKYFCYFIKFRLDIEKTQRTLKLYPKRIILIRHAEV